MFKLFLLLLFLSSCAMNKITHDNFNIKNHWIHSHEEDVGRTKVYRPSSYKFRPSRGREEIILNEEGKLRYRPISPNDEPIFYKGNWTIVNKNLVLHYNNKKIVYKILEISDKTLKLKRI